MAINLESIQNTIGYEFNNTDILQQAFVRRTEMSSKQKIISQPCSLILN